MRARGFFFVRTIDGSTVEGRLLLSAIEGRLLLCCRERRPFRGLRGDTALDAASRVCGATERRADAPRRLNGGHALGAGQAAHLAGWDRRHRAGDAARPAARRPAVAAHPVAASSRAAGAALHGAEQRHLLVACARRRGHLPDHVPAQARRLGPRLATAAWQARQCRQVGGRRLARDYPRLPEIT